MSKKYREAMDHVQVTPDMRERILGNIEQTVPERKPERKSAKASHARRSHWLSLAACLALIVTAGVAFSSFFGSGGNNWSVRPSGSGGSGNVSSGNESTTISGDSDSSTVVVTRADSAGKQQLKYASSVSSKSKLSSSVGYTVNEPKSTPFTVTSEKYHVYKDGVAEIVYTGKNNQIEYRQAPVKTAEKVAVGFEESNGAGASTTASSTAAPAAQGSVEIPSDSATTADTANSTTASDEGMETYQTVVDGTTVTMTGKDGMFYTATWQDEKYVYSFKAYEPLTYDEMVEVVRSVE